MSWVNILKGGKAIVYPVFNQAVRNIIEDMNNFTAGDILTAVSDEYIELLKEGKHMHPSAIKQHARKKVRKDLISKTIANIKIHSSNVEQRGNRTRNVWRRIK